MELLRITEVPEEEVEMMAIQPALFRQPLAHDRGSAPVTVFRCCACGETHLMFNEVGLGYVHVTGDTICCALCEASAQLRSMA